MTLHDDQAPSTPETTASDFRHPGANPNTVGAAPELGPGLRRNDADAISAERGELSIALQPKYGRGPCAVPVRYLWAGALGAPTVLVLGGISADREVCATSAGAACGWWEDQVGAGKAIDLRRYRVLAIDWLTPAQLPGATAVSSEDQADAIAGLLGELGIVRAYACIGSSYGAMVGLALSVRHPQRLRRLVAISGAHRAHPLSIALRHIQREIVRAGLATGDPSAALSLARQLAMTTYRGAEEFGQRFDAEPEFRGERFHFPVEDYLTNAGARFVARFDARRFLALSESIDLHRIDPAALRVPSAVVAIASDRLVPLDDLRQLAAASGATATLHEIDSPFGHDAFLKEPERIGAVVRAALDFESSQGPAP